MDKSDFLENAVLNHVLRNSVYTPSTTIEVRLFTALPNEVGAGGAEVSGAGYVRQSVVFAAPSGGTVVNQDAVTFPQATDTWGTVVGLGLYENADAGAHLLYFGSLSVAKAIDVGDQLVFAAGTMTVSEA